MQTQTNEYKTRIDFELCLSHLRMLFRPQEWIEFRSFQGRDDASHCWYTTLERVDRDPQQKKDLHAWLEDHNSDLWKGIYFGVNPRDSRQGSGKRGMGTDQDVQTFRSVFVDFDDADYEEAINRVQKASLPDPTLSVASGRLSGTHLYWIFEQEIEDDSIWRGLQRALISTLHTDASIHNPSRIMRLAGTYNYVRKNDCTIIREHKKLASWDDLGIPTKKMFERDDWILSSNVPPDKQNLNLTTLLFLREPCEEGYRNTTLFAAAMDYHGNGFPIEDAIRELGDERAIRRDGLGRGEAYRTIRNAYRRNSNPTHTPSLIQGPEDEKYTMLGIVLNLKRGAPDPDWDVEADIERARNPTPIDPDPLSNKRTKELFLAQKKRRTELAKLEDQSLPMSVEDLPPWQYEYGDVDTNVYIANCTYVNPPGQRKKTLTISRPVGTIAKEMFDALGGWPKYCEGIGPFFLLRGKASPKIHAPRNPSDLFSVLQAHGTVHWPAKPGAVFTEDMLRSSLTSKSEFFEYLSHTPIDNGHYYESISYYPQFPINPRTFYVPLRLPESTGKHLKTLFEAFNAETEADRQLLLSALLTPGWGGPPGTRPIFILTSDHGQGSGKTETAKLIGEIWGGAVSLDPSLPWDQLTKSIMSSQDYLSRVFLFDNLKGRFSASAIEAGVTAKRISGHRMYHGTVTRPNDATFLVTYNMPELSRDLAQRAIVIKLGKPSSKNFIVWANDYLSKYRLELISDLMAMLGRGAARVPSGAGTRWRAWQEGVMAKIPGVDVEALTELVRSRQGVSDGERSDGVDVAFALREYLVREGRYQGDHADHVTAVEVWRVLLATGVWKGKESWSETVSRRMSLKFARESLMGSPLLSPADPARYPTGLVRVDSEGSPTGSRGRSRSQVFRFEIEQADRWLSEQGLDPDPIQTEMRL